MEQSLTSCLIAINKELYTLIAQYGSACLLADKDNATAFNRAIHDTLNNLDLVITKVAKMEAEFKDHADILYFQENAEALEDA